MVAKKHTKVNKEKFLKDPDACIKRLFEKLDKNKVLKE